MTFSKLNLLIGGVLFVICVTLLAVIKFENLSLIPGFYLFILLVSYPPVFIIGVIFSFHIVLKEVVSLFYVRPKKDIESVLESRLRTRKDIAGFILWSMIITGLLGYLVSTVSFQEILGLVPGTQLVHSIEKPCEIAGVTLLKINPDYLLTVVIVGPVWLFLLRQVRRQKGFESEKKTEGGRSLMIFFYLVIFLFIAHHFLGIGCESQKTIFNLTLRIPEALAFDSLAVAVFLGIPSAILVLIFEKFIISKLISK